MSGELAQAVRQVAGQATQDIRLIAYGYVSKYNSDGHTVELIYPTYRTATGDPMLSQPIPLGTIWAGDGFGFQAAPIGGATSENPSGNNAELCGVFIIQRGTGAQLAGFIFYSDKNRPPAPGDGSDGENDDPPSDQTIQDMDGSRKLQGGEAIMKCKGKAFIKWYKSGDMQIHGEQDIVLRAKRDFILDVAEGKANVNVMQGNASITVAQGDLDMTTTKGSITISSGKDFTLNVTGDYNQNIGL